MNYFARPSYSLTQLDCGNLHKTLPVTTTAWPQNLEIKFLWMIVRMQFEFVSLISTNRLAFG